MNKVIVLAVVVALSACGLSAKNNEMVGQVKKVVEQTPIFCGDYAEADISLGVLRNGGGSMSKEDVVLYVADQDMVKLLKRAAEDGSPVKVTYDIQRLAVCRPDHWLTSVQVIEAK